MHIAINMDMAICSRTDNCQYVLIWHDTMLKGYSHRTETSQSTLTQYHLWIQIHECRHAVHPLWSRSIVVKSDRQWGNILPLTYLHFGIHLIMLLSLAQHLHHLKHLWLYWYFKVPVFKPVPASYVMLLSDDVYNCCWVVVAACSCMQVVVCSWVHDWYTCNITLTV